MARPIRYDEQAVVQTALEQFWQDGFNGCSVDALVDGTGLNKHILYQAFGGKNGLFRRALESYLQQYSHHYMAVFDSKRGLDALRDYFRAVLRNTDPRGCLVANTAVELGDADAACRRLLADYYDQLGARFARAIRQGQRDGCIRAELHARDTALWLVRATQGLAVAARLDAQASPAVNGLLALLATPAPEQSTQ